MKNTTLSFVTGSVAGVVITLLVGLGAVIDFNTDKKKAEADAAYSRDLVKQANIARDQALNVRNDWQAAYESLLYGKYHPATNAQPPATGTGWLYWSPSTTNIVFQ